MKYFPIIFFIVFLSACQSTLIKSDGAYFQVNSLSSIEITQELSVPANSARAFFQYGELLSHTGINLYAVSCEVMINTVSESRQIIAPGVFDITSISQDESPIVMRKAVQLAALDFSYEQYALGGGGSSPVDIHRYFRFKLAAQDPAKQISQVRSVTCRGVQDDPYNAELPTFNEMQAALGRFVRFNFK